jgi:phage minor structural protein
VAVYARHIAYDLMGIPVAWAGADSCSEAVEALKEAAVVDCPFVFYTDVTSSAAFQIGLPRPLWRCLGGMEGSILDTYGGEFEFDRWTVKHLTRRGTDRGVTIRYGKNLSTLEQDKNCAEVYTGVLAFWSDVDRTKVLIQSPPILKVDGDFTHNNIFVLDLSEYFSEPPSYEDFKAKVNSYISANNLGKPKVSWKISFVPLSKTQEYAHLADLEEVYLGDTVTVYFPAMDVDVSARVTEAEYDVLAEHYTSVTLGSVRDNLARTIAKQGAQIATKPSVGLTKAIATQVSSGL